MSEICKIIDKYRPEFDYQTKCVCIFCSLKKGTISKKAYYSDILYVENPDLKYIVNCKDEVMRPSFYYASCPNYKMEER